MGVGTTGFATVAVDSPLSENKTLLKQLYDSEETKVLNV